MTEAKPSTESPDQSKPTATYAIRGILIGGVILFAAYLSSWIFIFAIMPACLIAFQGIYLLIGRHAKMNPLGEAAARPALEAKPPSGGIRSYCESREDIRKRVKRQALQEVGKQYGNSLIALDYFIPAALNMLVGILVAWVLYHRPPRNETDDGGTLLESTFSGMAIHEGAIFGALGAYAYVTITLGRRTLQRDVTPGAAIWSTVQLLLGPVLGGVMAAALDSSVAGPTETLRRVAFYFFVGLFPLEIVGIIQSTVRRFFGTQTVTAKLIPLQQIRGINSTIEERLFEEGITDGYQLAHANPIRLHRNMPFDLRQILAWMDECLLYATVPDWVDALQKAGFPGAVDFAYFWETTNDKPDDPTLVTLAQRLDVDPKMLFEVLRRLNEDAQVQMVWFLYQYPDELNPENGP